MTRQGVMPKYKLTQLDADNIRKVAVGLFGEGKKSPEVYRILGAEYDRSPRSIERVVTNKTFVTEG